MQDRTFDTVDAGRALDSVGSMAEQLQAILHNKICSVCSERTVDGECGLENPSDCALFRMFPQVAAAVLATRSDDIRDYVTAIRERVCAQCAGQNEDGTCVTRQEVRCALDAYLLPIVDAIEEATGRVFDRSRMVIGPELTQIH